MKIKYLVSAKEMKQYDNYTIEKLGIPSLVLMERAALVTVDEIEKVFGELAEKSVLVVCGGGNNGGDGAAIARLLMDKGCMVEVASPVSSEKYSEQMRIQAGILKNYKQSILGIFPKREYDIIVDALFGVGLSRGITDESAEWIQKMNQSQAYVVSVDIPSGINANNGKCMNQAVYADLTVTYGFYKRGHFLFPGKKYCGRVVCRDIGISERSFHGILPEFFTYKEGVEGLLPERFEEGNKGTFGKLLVIAGSRGMGGACLLCAESAYRTGAGMVKVVTEASNTEYVLQKLPECMLNTYEDGEMLTKATKGKESFFDRLEKDLLWADGIVAGPGMGQSEEAAAILEYILKNAEQSLILDADALNLMAKDKDLFALAAQRLKYFPNSTLIITPHQGELSRLCGEKIEVLKEKPVLYASRLADEIGGIVVSKDAITYVCEQDAPYFINTAGNDGMATAGSGDVLSGILGGLLVQGIDGFDCAAKGVYLHACAGDWAAKHYGRHAMIAGDLIKGIIEVSRQDAKGV